MPLPARRAVKGEMRAIRERREEINNTYSWLSLNEHTGLVVGVDSYRSVADRQNRP